MDSMIPIPAIIIIALGVLICAYLIIRMCANEALNRRPTGKWIDIGNEGLVFKCSLCGNKNTIESNYCPNCGAKMESEG